MRHNFKGSPTKRRVYPITHWVKAIGLIRKRTVFKCCKIVAFYINPALYIIVAFVYGLVFGF